MHIDVIDNLCGYTRKEHMLLSVQSQITFKE